MAYDTTNSVVDDVTDNLAQYHNELKTALDHVMSATPYAAYKSATSMTGNVTLSDADYPIQSFSPTAARDLTLPTVASTNHAYYVVNRSATYAITVKNAGGTTITTIAVSSSAMLFSDGSNGWYAVSGGAAAAGGSTNRNVLLNGGMRVAQRGAGPFTSATTFVNNDDSYLLDNVIFLANGSDTCDVSRVADTNFVSGYKIRLDVETANRRFGILIPVENRDIQEIRKSAVASLQFKVKCTGTSMSNVRAYVLSWDGTADAITSDVISAWGSAGADPTFVANWTAENTASNLAITTTIATKTIENIAVDTASVANLAVLIIVDDTDATVGDFLEIGDVKLESGATCTTYQNEAYADELLRCKRYFFPLVVAGGTFSQMVEFGIKYATKYIDCSVLHAVEMRATPTQVLAASTAWVTAAPSGNQVSCYYIAGAGFATITGALTMTITANDSFSSYIRFEAGTSFSPADAGLVYVYVGAGTAAGMSAEL